MSCGVLFRNNCAVKACAGTNNRLLIILFLLCETTMAQVVGYSHKRKLLQNKFLPETRIGSKTFICQRMTRSYVLWTWGHYNTNRLRGLHFSNNFTSICLNVCLGEIIIKFPWDKLSPMFSLLFRQYAFLSARTSGKIFFLLFVRGIQRLSFNRELFSMQASNSTVHCARDIVSISTNNCNTNVCAPIGYGSVSGNSLLLLNLRISILWSLSPSRMCTHPTRTENFQVLFTQIILFSKPLRGSAMPHRAVNHTNLHPCHSTLVFSLFVKVIFVFFAEHYTSALWTSQLTVLGAKVSYTHRGLEAGSSSVRSPCRWPRSEIHHLYAPCYAPPMALAVLIETEVLDKRSPPFFFVKTARGIALTRGAAISSTIERRVSAHVGNAATDTFVPSQIKF